MTSNKNKAIDLIVEDLKMNYFKIKNIAKNNGCEGEFDVVNQQILDYVSFLRKMP